MEGRDRQPPDDDAPWATPASEDPEPEPDWAEQIRSSRRARGTTLREVYAKFAEEPTPLDDEPTPVDGADPE
ncbi:MAG: hypothetical protein ABI635_09400 [Actinomycetota bacterium]